MSMKRGIYGWLIGVLLPMLAGCSGVYYARSGSGFEDDMYGVHNRADIARLHQTAAERAHAEAEANRAQWETLLAEYEEQNGGADADEYSYGSVLADTYESAYARRLKGFRSLSYQMPGSYYNLRYSPAYHYVTAYDPMNYNIIVMGDEVWVEPKYISSMFGTWGAPSFSMTVGSGGWYAGFYYDWLWPSNYYSSWWGYPHYPWWSYDPYWSWNYGWPYYGWPYYGPGWPAPHPPHHPHPGGGGGGSHKPSTPHYPNYRPSNGSTPGGVRPSSPHQSPRGNYNYRGGTTISGGGNYRGSSTPGGVNSGSNYRGSKQNQAVGSGNKNQSGTSNRTDSYNSRQEQNRNAGNNYRQSSGSTNYRSSGSSSGFSSGGGSYRSSGSGGNSGGNYRGGR